MGLAHVLAVDHTLPPLADVPHLPPAVVSKLVGKVCIQPLAYGLGGHREFQRLIRERARFRHHGCAGSSTPDSSVEGSSTGSSVAASSVAVSSTAGSSAAGSSA